jgi:glycerol-3-phosphate dehydrogenase (NAD(P)+)
VFGLNKPPLLVLGAGSWGTALALVLARNEHTVYLWDCNADHIRDLSAQGCNNRHLPGVVFPQNLVPVVELAPRLEAIADVVIAVPCEALPDVLGRMQAAGRKDFRICLACKGLEPETHSLSHVMVMDYLGDIRLAVISGPSFAAEVAAGIPTAVAVVSSDEETAAFFAACFHNEKFRIYTHHDLIGVQIAGAIKNVMAIAAGIADGLGYGANTRAALITRGLAEITRLGVAMGARQETFMGLAGLGDLVLTCTDDQSRNRRLGLALARGKSVDEARQEIGQAIEGLRTARAVHALATEYAIEMPISEQIYQVVNGHLGPQEAVQALLSREQTTEI